MRQLGMFFLTGCVQHTGGLVSYSISHALGIHNVNLNIRRWTWCIFCMFLLLPAKCDDTDFEYMPVVNVTYRDKVTGKIRSEESSMGRYSAKSLLEDEWGVVVHVRSKNQTTGCHDIDHKVPSGKWIALIQRGNCQFSDKIHNAVEHNASAVVVYNNKPEKDLVIMQHEEQNVVSIFVYKHFGQRVAKLVDSGTKVTMYIMVSKQKKQPIKPSISKTSVLFVSISFIVLMIISLAWLVFYYIQRFRYAHAKERLSRRLANAAKKAIAKIPQRTVKPGDKELSSDSDQCAVCIEGYKAADVIRVLPCKHEFHKSCVDPWLLDQRSCPMCKMDILRAYGMQLNGSQDSVVAIDPESGGTGSALADEVDPLSTPDEHGAVGGIKVVRFSHPSVQFHGHLESHKSHDSETAAIDAATEETALTSGEEIISRDGMHSAEQSNCSGMPLASSDLLQDKPSSKRSSLNRAQSYESIPSDPSDPSDDYECNEKQSLMTSTIKNVSISSKHDPVNL